MWTQEWSSPIYWFLFEMISRYKIWHRPWQDSNLQSSRKNDPAQCIGFFFKWSAATKSGPDCDNNSIVDARMIQPNLCFFLKWSAATKSGPDRDRTLTCNPQIRSLMPYPLGHTATDIKSNVDARMTQPNVWVSFLNDQQLQNLVQTVTGLEPAILRSEAWCLIH